MFPDEDPPVASIGVRALQTTVGSTHGLRKRERSANGFVVILLIPNSMDWFKGKSAGNHVFFYHQLYRGGSSSNFPSSQSIDK